MQFTDQGGGTNYYYGSPSRQDHHHHPQFGDQETKVLFELKKKIVEEKEITMAVHIRRSRHVIGTFDIQQQPGLVKQHLLLEHQQLIILIPTSKSSIIAISSLPNFASITKTAISKYCTVTQSDVRAAVHFIKRSRLKAGSQSGSSMPVMGLIMKSFL